MNLLKNLASFILKAGARRYMQLILTVPTYNALLYGSKACYEQLCSVGNRERTAHFRTTVFL